MIKKHIYANFYRIYKIHVLSQQVIFKRQPVQRAHWLELGTVFENSKYDMKPSNTIHTTSSASRSEYRGRSLSSSDLAVAVNALYVRRSTTAFTAALNSIE